MTQNQKALSAIGGVKVVPMTPEIISKLILTGDVSQLLPAQKVEYITKLCERVGLDPLTQPFKLLKLQGREVLYADKGATQQLCQVHNISTEVTKKEMVSGVYVVTVRAHKDGRYTDEDGAVTVDGLRGDALCNALMKAITKAKRRAVLALCGLGMLDETEIETIPNAVPVQMPQEVPATPQMQPIAPELMPDPNDDPIPWGAEEPPPTDPLPVKKPTDLISEPQRKRLYAISMGAGMTQVTFKIWLKKQGYESSKDIPKSDYQRICEEAEAYNPVEG